MTETAEPAGGTDGDLAAADHRWMGEALARAGQMRGLTSPNPMVGAVVVRAGRMVGHGAHERAGAPHAEAVALAGAGPHARDATLYVTLEPCTHSGRTPPCVPAVVAAGVRRVVIAVRDPNARVAGGGVEALRSAGIDVVVGCRAEEARELNRVFFTAMTRLRPHVTLKCAMTLDGKIAAVDRRSRWITGEPARREAHRMRSEADAVVVGIGTALADDPALTVRREGVWPREPLRVVVDSQARLPPTARLIDVGSPARAVLATTDTADGARVDALARRGLTVLRCKSDDRGRVDLRDLCERLYAMDVIGVLVEGGAALGAGFLEAGLVDRVAFFIAPKILGGVAAPTAVGGPGRLLATAVRVTAVEVRAVGEDWLFEGAVSEGDLGRGETREAAGPGSD
jgi:diaminohydroxyphosphoribosylaminopyrimidine deaminase/5-amino-6-(5-phosphoribosylamino)uracil reductase